MKYFAAAIMMVSATPVQADVYRYTCRVDGKSLTVRIDDARKTLRWRNKTYAITVQEDCAKFGWRATRPGETFDFCTATQGYADFQQGDRLIQCDQDR
ncbi:hypothetical protein HNR00_004765 [Methylorubrum rhodinum]|uniref:C-type lysozyme inhibitor domain-containing protein n=1 Tax=Methylorubrum rhodinum TaxID=29428 RepID=A0A840ZSL9_9HYPH|nr:hypothetical protein [Methylorubrum rhodinum]MBB5760025.1 hypothetical protein [Methylorubrum rhodinum]